MASKKLKNLKNGDKYGNTAHVDILRKQIKEFIHETHEHFILLNGGRHVGKTFTSQIAILTEDVMINGGLIRLLIHRKGLIKKGVLKAWWKKMLEETGETSRYDFKWTGERGYYRLKGFDEEDWTLFTEVLWTGDAEDDKLFNNPDMRWLVMDETAVAGAKPDEVYEMLDAIQKIYDTHDRLEGRVRFLAMCNTIDASNPIYTSFGVPPANLTDEHIGEVIRGEDTIYWYVPRPRDLDEKSKERGKTIRQMSKGYADYSEGRFRSSYGQYIKKPPEALSWSSVYSIKFEDLCYAGIGKGSDGFTYIECWNRDQYNTCPKRYVLDPSVGEDGDKVLPPARRDILKQIIERGKLRFCTIEDLTIFSIRLKTFGLKI